MNFVAMDFETANAKRYSACSLALTIVRNNHIEDEFYSLINPGVPFSWRNIQFHGIHRCTDFSRSLAAHSAVLRS